MSSFGPNSLQATTGPFLGVLVEPFAEGAGDATFGPCPFAFQLYGFSRSQQ